MIPGLARLGVALLFGVVAVADAQTPPGKVLDVQGKVLAVQPLAFQSSGNIGIRILEHLD